MSASPARRPGLRLAWLVGLAFVLPVSTGLAAEDPLKSQACGEALAALQAAREQLRGTADHVERLRRTAANVCLGGATSSTRPSPTVRLPESLPSVRQPPTVTVPGVSPPIPPLAYERLPLPGVCDTAGCWSDDGQRLRHTPTLPAGPCSLRGGVMVCP
jgi:hypothetical protein